MRSCGPLLVGLWARETRAHAGEGAWRWSAPHGMLGATSPSCGAFVSDLPDLLPTLRYALAGRYAVERELGRGGMATVFLAEDLKHHRPVAIKVLHQELAAALGADRFLREIEIAARLQHPHILPLYDSGRADGLLFYVMPYVEGESRSEEHTSELQSLAYLVCRLLLEKKKKKIKAPSIG